MFKTKKTPRVLEVPEDTWVSFIEVLFTAVQHITVTEENITTINFLRNVITKAFEDGDILVVDGKIIAKDEL